MINSFTREYSFLSNFYLCEIEYEGIIYPSSEHAYQAHKSNDIEIRKYVATLETPGLSKKAGRLLDKRDDWDEVKFRIMKDILVIKFKDFEMSERLLETNFHNLVEGNYWHDNIWGDCSCGKCKHILGQNHLGIILMDIRTEIFENKLNSQEKMKRNERI